MFELIHTSVPKGLKENAMGFCSVAWTQGMPANYVVPLEQLSGYRMLYNPDDPRYSKNPVVFSCITTKIAGKSMMVVSRIGCCGLDYSGRSNKIAHHVVIEKHEISRNEFSGAGVLLFGGFLDHWDGPPKLLPVRILGCRPLPPAKAVVWERLTGDAGNAGVAADWFVRNPGKSVFLEFAEGTDSGDLLKMAAEVTAVLPPEKACDFTFSTFFSGSAQGTVCFLRAAMAGSMEIAVAKRLRANPVFTLGSPVHVPGNLESNCYVRIARLGAAALAVPAHGAAKTAPEIELLRWAPGVPAGTASKKLRIRESLSGDGHYAEEDQKQKAEIARKKAQAANEKRAAAKKRLINILLLVLFLLVAGGLVTAVILLLRPPEDQPSEGFTSNQEKGSPGPEPAAQNVPVPPSKLNSPPKDETSNSKNGKTQTATGRQKKDPVPAPARPAQTKPQPPKSASQSPTPNPVDFEQMKFKVFRNFCENALEKPLSAPIALPVELKKTERISVALRTYRGDAALLKNLGGGILVHKDGGKTVHILGYDSRVTGSAGTLDDMPNPNSWMELKVESGMLKIGFSEKPAQNMPKLTDLEKITFRADGKDYAVPLVMQPQWIRYAAKGKLEYKDRDNVVFRYLPSADETRYGIRCSVPQISEMDLALQRSAKVQRTANKIQGMPEEAERKKAELVPMNGRLLDEIGQNFSSKKEEEKPVHPFEKLVNGMTDSKKTRESIMVGLVNAARKLICKDREKMKFNSDYQDSLAEFRKNLAKSRESLEKASLQKSKKELFNVIDRLHGMTQEVLTCCEQYNKMANYKDNGYGRELEARLVQDKKDLNDILACVESQLGELPEKNRKQILDSLRKGRRPDSGLFAPLVKRELKK